MFSKSTSLALLSLALAASAQRSGTGLPCDPVHIIAARGSTDPYPGPQGSIIDSMCAQFGSGVCGYEDVVYPATFDNYCSSITVGFQNGISQITSFAQRCPNSKIVLTGFSQGANVIGDILGGAGGSVTGCQQQTLTGLSPSTFPGNRITAVTLFGNVRHTANQAYNAWTGAAKDGIAPRSGTLLQNLNRWTSVLRDWCNVNDTVCARGPDGNAHGSYFTQVNVEAGRWVKSMVDASSSPTGTATGTGTPTTTSSTPTTTQPVAQKWGQCGGIGWQGATACVSGSTCVKVNDYYSQCQ